MTLETSVANLTTATTALLTAVNVQKTVLDTATTTATAQAGIATAQASGAASSATMASVQAANSATQASLSTAQTALAAAQVTLATTQATNAAGSSTTAATAQVTAAAQAVLAATQSISAQTSAGSANTAAGVAAGAARLFVDDTTGLAATAEGGYYSIPSGSADEVAIIKQKVGGAVVDTGKRTPSASAIVGTTVTQGVYPATDGNGTTANGFSIFSQQPVTSSGVLTGLSVFVATAGAGALVVASINGDGTLKLEEAMTVPLAIGANTFAGFNPYVKAGWLVGVYADNGIRFTTPIGANPAIWSTVGIPGTAAAKTASGVTAQLGWVVKAGALNAFGLAEVYNSQRSQALDAKTQLSIASQAAAVVGATVAQGQTPPVSLGNVLVDGYTAFTVTPFSQSGALASLSVFIGTAGTGRLLVITKNGDNSINLVASKAVTFSAGLNVFKEWFPEVVAGQYAAVYLDNSGVSYASAGGDGARYCLGLPGVSTATTSINATGRFAIGWTLASGLKRTVVLENEVSSLKTADIDAATSINKSGVNLLIAADATGVADSTTTFAAAALRHPKPEVPIGNFAVASLPSNGDGFCGAGKIFVNGLRHAIPARPQDAGLLLTARARHVRPIADGSALILLADSIGAHFNASSMPKHWFSMYERWVNSQIAPGGEIASVVVRDDAAGGTGETALFYGLTVSGGSNGTRGPVGRSVILAAGGYIEFTGNYAFVDTFYQQQAGAGSLAFSFNGGAAYKTLSAAGTTQLDKFSGPSATGQTASGVYRITATGAAVEITGITRQSALITAAGTPNRLNCMRMCYGGSQAADFSDARVDAILAQANGIGGGASHEVYVGLGTNDMLFGASPAAYETNMQRIIARLMAGGVTKIRALSPIRTSFAAWSTYLVNGNKFDQYLASLVKVCAASNIPLLRFDAVDFFGRGLLSSDGLHPNDAGFDLMFDMIARWDAA